jgi:hypothetical protein
VRSAGRSLRSDQRRPDPVAVPGAGGGLVTWISSRSTWTTRYD